MKFNFEKLTKSAGNIYKETTAKVETLTTSHEGWYEKAVEKAKSFAKDIDPNLSVLTEHNPLSLHFFTAFNPFIKWDMKITENAEYLNSQFKEDIAKKYAELAESPELKEKFRLFKIEADRVNKLRREKRPPQELRREDKGPDLDEAMQEKLRQSVISDALSSPQSSSHDQDFMGGGGNFGGGGASGGF